MMGEKPQHAPILAFSSADGVLSVGGKSIHHWIDVAGGTPLFLYEKAFIDKRIAYMRGAMPEDISLHYAVKANPLPELVTHMAHLCDGLDVASKGEMEIALQSGAKAETISFAGPGKRDVELDAALRAGCLITLESANEARRLADIAQRLGRKPKVAVRVNPDFELKNAGMRMSGGPKPFGIDAEDVPALLRELPAMGLDFQGFHIFSGSQNLNAGALMEAQTETIALALKLAQSAPQHVRWLNIGGGFGVPYFPGDRHLDLRPIGENLDKGLQRIRTELGHTEVVLELGRYLVAEAGVYLTRVVDRKVSRGEVFLITDGGLHHQLAASGNFGQVLRKNYPVAVANHYGEYAQEVVNIVGCLCTPLDRLGDKVALPHVVVGDIIAVFMAGAYGASASPERFLGHPAAYEMLV